MADRRMKAVADDDDSVHGDDEVVLQDERVEDMDDLDLGLTLGRWGWTTGTSNNGRAESHNREPLPRLEGGVGSSRYFERQRSVPQSPPQLVHRQPSARDWGTEIFGIQLEGQGDVGSQDEAFDEMERASSDTDMDTQHKRPKVLASLGLTGSSYHEANVQLENTDSFHPNLSVLSENEATYRLGPFTNGEVVKPDGSHDADVPTGNDVEIRMDLSDDLLHLIFSFLGQKDLCRAGATCKQWLVASTHEDFWRCLNFENTRISEQNFSAICHRYPNASEVNMHGIPNANMLVVEAMSSLRRLETLILVKGQFGDPFFHALTDCPALVSLRIDDAYLGNGIQEISVYHERLRDLHIVKCRLIRISVRCPQLRSLSLKRTSMAHASLTCPQLHELDLSSCHKLSDTAIRQAVTTCPLLSILDISSCSSVSDETVRDISLACPSLCVLDASNCPNISFESVRLLMLMELKLQSCEGITSASMSAIAYSRMLEALQLDNCGLLTSISLDLPRLRNLSLVHLRKFVDLHLRSPMLQYIKVSRCSALHRISIMSNVLQKLVLQKQESLATLSLQCQNLQEVDLSDCESLTNSVCKVFSNSGGCPMLRSLILDNCESLSKVCFSSSSLVSLSLAGCRAMVSLDLSSHNLRKLNLDGCDHLERASFCPVGLESLNLGICPKLSELRIEAPNMSVLELKGCGVLAQASISCPYLTSLDASFCRQFMDESLSSTVASCSRIECLILSSCLSIGYDGLSSLHWLQQLALLDLSYTFLMNLQPVFDACSQLVILKLSACKYLMDSSLDPLYKEGALPVLHELDLSYSSIGQTAISELLAYCTNLVHINLNGCANMQELVWDSNDCHSTDMMVDACLSDTMTANEKTGLRKSKHLLEILNCTGCPNIKKVLIPSMANCFLLSKINLNLSTNLKEVDLTCSNLGTLNLSYCSSLEILKLDCPRLNNLQLLACSMLEEEELEGAISKCKMLEILNIHACPKLYAEDFERLHGLCPTLKRIQGSLSL